MANYLKELLNRPLPRGNATHASLMAVVGGYLIYMAYQMVQNTLSGASSMPMSTTGILAGIMGLCGLGAIGYAVYLWRAAVKKTAEDAGESDQDKQ